MKSVCPNVMPANDMKWTGKEKKKEVCGHADKMNQPGMRFGYGPDGERQEREEAEQGFTIAASRGRKKKEGGEMTSLNRLPFFMSARWK